MFNFAKYQLSKTHGFCLRNEPLRYLPSLSKHIAVLRKPLSFDPRDVASLPELSGIDSLTYREKELAFLVHLMLNSLYYWRNEAARTIPKNLAVPTVKLSQALCRPPIINMASLGIHNWRYLNPTKKFHPDNVEMIFSFSTTRDETNFFHCESYIEILGAPALVNLLKLHHAFDTATIDKEWLVETQKSLAKMRQGLEMIYSRVDPDLFFNGFRHNIKSYEKGVIFEGTNVEYQHLQGSSGVQSPLIKFIDAALGIDHKNEFLDSTDAYIKKQHRDLLAYIRKKDKSHLKDAIAKNKLVNEWNDMISELHGFRHDHIRLTQHFIDAPSGQTGNKGTAGSSLTEFLQEITDRTKTHLI